MMEDNNLSQAEIDKINQKLAAFIGNSTYGFDGDPDEELPSYANVGSYDLLDDSIFEIDFSEFKGDFKENIKKIQGEVKRKEVLSQPKTRKRPTRSDLIKKINVGKLKTPTGSKKFNIQELDVRREAKLNQDGKMNRVLIPKDRKVIVEGVSKFLLSNSESADAYRNIGYYKGKKLHQLVLLFNNSSPLDFNLELFNPSMPLDYLYSTSQNLNNKIQVAGGNVEYSDVLFNILANPVFIPNATITISGAQVTAQKSVPFLVKNKFVNGVDKVSPVNIALQIDNMQVEGNNVSFDFMSVLNRHYVPDGMEVISYNVLAGNYVTMCFYYEQMSIKKLFFEESRKVPKMI